MTRALLQTIWETLPAEGWPPPGAALVIAASGGPDSTALCFLMEQLSDARGRDWRLHLAHLNHGLRPLDAEHDARFVEGLARTRGWTITVERRPAPIAQPAGGGVEERARRDRYALFQRALREVGATTVATAHHADDNVETILHRVIRGTGLRGLGGIPAMRPLTPGSTERVIRPLLRLCRRDLEQYLSDHGIASRTDHSNQIPNRTRNRLRHELLPQLAQTFNPGIRQALLRLACQARWGDTELRRAAEAAADAVVCTSRPAEGEIVLDAAALLEQPPVVQSELLRQAIADLGVGEKKLTFAHLQAIRLLAKRNVSGKTLHLPGSLTAHYQRGTLVLRIAAG